MAEQASTLIVIYDGDCGLCRACSAWLHRHDRRWRLDRAGCGCGGAPRTRACDRR